MHCLNCGSYLRDTARFCDVCGTPVADPEVTRLATRTSPQDAAAVRTNEAGDLERTIFTARPTLLFIKAGYVAAALGAVLLTITLALLLPSVSFYIWLPFALALLLIPAYYHIKRNTVLYTLTDSKIEIDQGLIARTTRNIPLRNIQDVTVSTTIPQRLLGLGNLVIENASEVGGVTVLRNINDPRKHADMLLRELRRVGR
ncbi:MAG: PH domain-containing protein [Acidobacteria bacterium]|nr:PH domain-containing protein [Acidobacteriota bacterium]